MKSLQVKSIVIIIIAILTSTNLFSQDQTGMGYTDKAAFFEGQNTRALKINFAGNFIGTTKITFEQMLKPGRSLELKATIVDLGEQGVIGSIGYKFYRKPTFIAPNMQRRNILEGTYLKPEVFFGMVKDEGLLYEALEATKTGGLLLNIGKQWVIGKNIVIDTYVGTGTGTGSYFRGYLVGGGLLVTGGINVGFTF